MEGEIPTAALTSFLVPTLNRGHYVVRAVASCLRAAEIAGTDVEVVVLDSQSNDGSWQLLQQNFQHDPRVLLKQNERGSGPVRSWLDAARLARGDFVTFVWSDDYISEHFLQALLPALASRRELAIGKAVVRDIDSIAPLPFEQGSNEVPFEAFLLGYFVPKEDGQLPSPFSPACSLFSRRALEAWIGEVERYSRATPLREDIMWRKAIGPDLLLYLMALRASTQSVFAANATTAQFSSHPGSISIFTPLWTMEVGYWLARKFVICDPAFRSYLSNAAVAAIAARLLIKGLRLVWQSRRQNPPTQHGVACTALLLSELRSLMKAMPRLWHLPRVASEIVAHLLLKRRILGAAGED